MKRINSSYEKLSVYYTQFSTSWHLSFRDTKLWIHHEIKLGFPPIFNSTSMDPLFRVAKHEIKYVLILGSFSLNMEDFTGIFILFKSCLLWMPLYCIHNRIKYAYLTYVKMEKAWLFIIGGLVKNMWSYCEIYAVFLKATCKYFGEVLGCNLNIRYQHCLFLLHEWALISWI